MKSLLSTLFLILVFLTSSCQSQDEVISPAGVAGQWQLTEVQPTSMLANQPSTPQEPPYQETIAIKADGTFRRYRSTGYEATGTYAPVNYGADDQGILLTFSDPESTYHDLPGFRQYSYTKGQVYLRRGKPGEFIESYMATDGYTFFYQKIENNN